MVENVLSENAELKPEINENTSKTDPKPFIPQFAYCCKNGDSELLNNAKFVEEIASYYCVLQHQIGSHHQCAILKGSISVMTQRKKLYSYFFSIK